MLYYVGLIYIALHFIGAGIAAAVTMPARTMATTGSRPRPILAYSVFSLVAQLLELERRMPWTAGGLAWGRHHLVDGALRVGAYDGPLDK